MLEQDVVDLQVERQQILKRLDTVASLVKSTGNIDSTSGKMNFTITGPDAPPQLLQQSTNLNTLLIERARLAATYTEDHRDVLRLDKQIASTRAVLNEELATLAKVMERDRARLQHLLKIEPRYNWLSRQVRILTDSYEVYNKAAKDRETFFDRDTQILAQVIDPPATTYHPLKPGRLILVIAGLVLSIFLALAGVLIIEWISQIRVLYANRPDSPADDLSVRKEPVPLQPLDPAGGLSDALISRRATVKPPPSSSSIGV